MKELRVKVTVRNNLLLSAIEAAGFKSQTEFAAATGFPLGTVNSVIAMRRAPLGRDGEFIDVAKAIMEVLGASPLDLWTIEQLTMANDRNSSELCLGIADLRRVIGGWLDPECLSDDPGDVFERDERGKVIRRVLETHLTPRQQKVLALRFGLDGCKEHTLAEIADQFDLGPERIRQIEAGALRKLRYQGPTKMMVEAGYLD